MFHPTHWLVSRSCKVPVALKSQGETTLIFTEAEWGKVSSPAFELRSKMGVYCRGIKVVGHELQPMLAVNQASEQPVEA